MRHPTNVHIDMDFEICKIPEIIVVLTIFILDLWFLWFLFDGFLFNIQMFMHRKR